MSVFTRVERAQLDKFLERYDVGRASAFHPVAAGITNTNYYVDTEAGAFVLTLYEHHGDEELAYLLGLQLHLSSKSIACPLPVRDRRGDLFSILNHRPAAIIERLPGEVESAPGGKHCRVIGAELARFHLAGEDFAGRRANPRGAEWALAVADMLAETLDGDDRELISTTLGEYGRIDFEALPAGAIHADLFHDNALFVDDQLRGIVDFDYACDDSFVLDIAVLLQDWCVDATGEFDDARLDATLGAYQQHRRLSPSELTALPAMLRFAALRFWLSRLHDKTFPLAGELTSIKDPETCRGLLLRRRAEGELLGQRFARHLLTD